MIYIVQVKDNELFDWDVLYKVEADSVEEAMKKVALSNLSILSHHSLDSNKYTIHALVDLEELTGKVFD